MWNEICTDFDPEEETVNFGTRNAFETKGALYEILTYATIESSKTLESVSLPERIKSVSNGTHVAFSLDSSLHVFSLDFSNVVSFQLNSNISSLTLSPCSKFLLLTLDSLDIRLLYIETKKLLPSFPIPVDSSSEMQSRIINAYFEGKKEKDEEKDSNEKHDNILLFTSNAKIFILGNVNLSGIEDSLQSGNLSNLKAIQSSMTITSIELETKENEFFPIQNVIQSEDSFVYFSQFSISFLSSDYSEIQKDLIFFTNLILLKSSIVFPTLLFGLEASGVLHIICSKTNLLLFSWTQEKSIAHFELVEDNGDRGAIKLLLVSKDESLSLRLYPSFKLEYELKETHFTHVMSTSINQETPLWIEASSEKTPKLRIRGVVEGLPESRLGRLLRRHKFEDAEKFANDFSLNTEIVYQAHANYIVEQLSPWKFRKETKVSDFLSPLQEILFKMKDLNYVVQICIGALLPTVEASMSLLIYCRSLIQEKLGDVSNDYLVQVSLRLLRIETFRLLRLSNVEDWIDFVKKEPLTLVKEFLQEGASQGALLIWHRHFCEFQKFLNSENLNEILNEVNPLRFEVTELLEWSKGFILSCLSYIPNSLEILLNWSLRSIKSLEIHHKSDWPQNALSLSENHLGMMSLDNFKTFEVSQSLSYYESSLSLELVSLIKALKDLTILSNNYKLKIKLSDLLNSNKKNVVFLICDWLTPEEIPSCMEEYLLDWMKSETLDICEILSEYSNDLILKCDSTWYWDIGEASWESKVKNLIPYINSPSHRVTVILNAVKSAPVPWSQTIQELAILGSETPHPNSEFISKQKTLVTFKHILRKYNIRQYVFVSSHEARKVLRLIINRSNGTDSGYSDALESLKALPSLCVLDAKEIYINYYLERNEVNNEFLVSSLFPEEKDRLWERIYIHARSLFKIHGSTSFNYEAYLSYLSANVPSSFIEEFQVFYRQVLLLSKYGIIYSGKENEIEILESFIHRTLDLSSSKSTRILYLKTLQLSCLLGVQKEIGLLSLIKVTARNRQFSALSDLLEAYSQFPFVSQTLEVIYGLYNEFLSVTIDIWQNIFSSSIPSLCFSLSISGALDCEEKDLIDFIELSLWQRLLCSHYEQMIMSQGRRGSQDDVREIFSLSRINKLNYRDKGLSLPLESLGPLLEILQSVFPFASLPLYLSSASFSSRRSLVFRRQQVRVKSLDESVIPFNSKATSSFFHSLSIRDLNETLENKLLSSTKYYELSSQSILSLSLFNTVTTIYKSLVSDSVNDSEIQRVSQKIRHLHINLTQGIFKRVLSERKRDLDLEFGLALLCEPSSLESHSILSSAKKSFASDVSKTYALARISLFYSKVVWPSQVEEISREFVESAWRRKASESGLTFKDSSPESLSALFCKFVASQSLRHLFDLKNFSMAFDICSQDLYVSYIRESVVNMGRVTPLLSIILQELSSSNFNLGDFLYDLILSEMSPYNYEILDYTLSQLCELPRQKTEELCKAKKILNFLLSYNRHKAPSSKETELWFGRPANYSHNSSTRLPLTPLLSLPRKEKFKLLEQEFSLSSYRLWIKVAPLLNFQPDSICIKAIENAFVDQESNAHSMIEYSQNNISVGIHECIASISNPFKATSCAHWVLSKYPMGENKIEAARDCAAMAFKWHESSLKDIDGSQEESAAKALEIAKNEQLILETKYILAKYKLDETKYMEFLNIHGIETLLKELYEHESIINPKDYFGKYSPDINRAASEIAALFDFNLRDLKYELLQNWLSDSQDFAYHDENDTLLIPYPSEQGGLQNNTDVNLMRCNYVCQCPEMHTYLVSYSLDAPNEQNPQLYTTHFKLRALTTLLSVVQDDKLSILTRYSKKELLDLHQNYKLLSRLEDIGLPYDMHSFKNIDKELLIQSIFRDSKSLPLVLDLSFTFYFYNPDFWSSLLLSLLNESSDLSLLKTVLLKLNHQPALWHLKVFRTAWNHLLLYPFQDRDVKKIEESILLLQVCPLELDIRLFWGECRRLQLFDLANSLQGLLVSDDMSTKTLSSKV